MRRLARAATIVLSALLAVQNAAAQSILRDAETEALFEQDRDAARTAATGAGLGLAIVDKTVQRMGGIFALANTTSGGLAAHIKLQKPRTPQTGDLMGEDEHRMEATL